MKALVVLVMVAATSQARYNYCKKVSKQHQLCGKQGVKEACLNTLQDGLPHEVPEDVQAAILAKHNQLRSKVALGNQWNQPHAANMEKMTWDKELARIAQAYANKCITGHDCACDCACDQGCDHGCHDVKKKRFEQVGQNVYRSWQTFAGYSPDTSNNFEEGVDLWFNEHERYPSSAVSSYDPAESTDGQAVGHYTQLVWATTSRLGCGFVMWEAPEGWTSPGGKWFKAYYKYTVCNYGPGGNMLGAPIYEEGPPATSCPPGTTANTDSGLCE